MVGCDFKDEYQTDMCTKEKIGLRAQNMATILDSVVNDMYDRLVSMRILTLIMKKIFI